jgi:cytochrome P450
MDRVRATLAPHAPRPPSNAATIDLAAPDIALDPFPHYEDLRRAGSVQFLAHHNAWIVLGYEQVLWAFGHPHLFSNRPYADVDAVLLAADPPEHTAIRRLVSAYFSRDVVERLGAFAAERAATLIKPRFDIVRDYGQPLSQGVAARLLGFDDATVDEVHEASVRSVDFAHYILAIDALADRADLYGRLRADGLDDAPARSLVRLFWVASTKTTERVIAQCVMLLLRHAEVRAEIERDLELIGPFIEEVMRLHQPEPMLRRWTTQQVELGGAHIPAGSQVYLSLAAANRDPTMYEQPAELRLDRSTSRHLTFGSGIHHCIGATLARAELTAALRTLLVRAPRFRAAQQLESVQYCATMMAHYIESLVVDVP